MSKTLAPLVQFAKNNTASRLLTSTVIFGISTMLPFNLQAEEVTQLPTVTVIDSKANEKYNPTESSYYKIAGPLLDRPQTVTTISQQVMKDQGNTTLRDALRNVPGISIAAGEAGAQGDSLTIRGFTARNDFFIDGMRDFGSYYRDPFNLESVEVIQGPSSILFGRGSTGGVISQNSKQAFLGSQQNGSVAFGTNSTRRATADVNAQIPGLKGAAFRLNAMAHESNVAGRDEAKNARFGFAPTLAFGLGTDTRTTISYLHQNENDIPDYGLPWVNGQPANVKRSNFYGFKSNDYLKTSADILTGKFERDLDKSTTFRNQTRYARYTRSAVITEPQASTAAGSLNTTLDTSGGSTPTGSTALSSIYVNPNMIAAKSLETYLGDQADLTSKFSTFDVKHNLVTGAAIEHETSSPTRYTYTTKSGSTTNYSTPAQSLLDPNEDLGFTGTPTISAVSVGKLDTLAAYAIDTIKFNDKWQLMASIRLDHVKSSFSQTLLTPVNVSRNDNLLSYHEGLVYKPTKDSSVYVDYGTSFNPSAESFSLISGTASTAQLAPEKNTIYEVGTKWDFFKKRLSTAFSLFRSEKLNGRETDPTNSNAVLMSGLQRVNGFQAQATGNITDRWKIMAGYSYMDGEVLKSSTVSVKGNGLANVPKNTFNLFTIYKLPSNLEVGGGVNYVGQRYATTANDIATGQQKSAGGYTAYNLMAKYPVSKTISMQINVNNLTNKYYFDQIHPGHVVPGEGRVILLTTNFTF